MDTQKTKFLIDVNSYVKQILAQYKCIPPIPVSARSKTWFWSSSLTGIVGSNPVKVWLYCVSDSCTVDVSASGWSLVQRSPTECGMSEYNHEASIMRRSWPSTGCWDMVKEKIKKQTRTHFECQQNDQLRRTTFSITTTSYEYFMSKHNI
jgi:hypothetical protein